MKQWTKRILAIVLALAMTGGVLSASAAGEEENRVVNPVSETGYTLGFLDKNGTVVDSVKDEVGGVEKDVYKNVAKVKVSFTGTAGKQYVVFLLSGDTAVPTKNNICYIDQKAGAASMEFIVYPTQLTNPGTYTVLVASEDGLVTAGSFAVAEPEYILGDVDKSGEMDVGDVVKLMQYVAKLIQADDPTFNLLAGDVDNSGEADVGDVVKMMRVIAKLDQGF